MHIGPVTLTFDLSVRNDNVSYTYTELEYSSLLFYGCEPD